MDDFFDPFDDEMWDEHQWEAHINEIERKSDQLRKFIEGDRDPGVPRWAQLLRESENEDDAVESFIEEELAFEEAYFPDDEDEDWDDEFEDYEDDLFLSDELFGNEADDDFEEGEEWKELSADYASSDEGSIDNLAIYVEARDYSVDALKWIEQVPERDRTITHNQFVSQVLQIGAKIASGYSFGFDIDYIGANIAYCKKALQAANSGLALLQRMKESGTFYAGRESYGDLHSRLFELRNDIGVYVQELRERYFYGF